jgi:hypothetical protein
MTKALRSFNGPDASPCGVSENSIARLDIIAAINLNPNGTIPAFS